MHVVWLCENALAQSEYPGTTSLDDLHDKGIRAIVSLERRPDADVVKEKGFEYLEECIEDHTAPSMEQLIRINQFIDSMMSKQRPVLVHCLLGSRSGAILVSHLIYHGKSYTKAFAEVKNMIPITGDYSSLREALKKFEKECKRRNAKQA